jgi:hypothetical protein
MQVRNHPLSQCCYRSCTFFHFNRGLTPKYSTRTIRVGDCVRYVSGKAVNGRSVDDVLKDLVGDEGHSLEVSFRAADEAKSQVCSPWHAQDV